MTDGSVEPELGDPIQRTLLAWRRTALSLVAACLLVGHLTAEAGAPVLGVTLAGVALVVAFVWLGARPMAVNGVVLVAGVLLVGATALVGIAR